MNLRLKFVSVHYFFNFGVARDIRYFSNNRKIKLSIEITFSSQIFS